MKWWLWVIAAVTIVAVAAIITFDSANRNSAPSNEGKTDITESGSTLTPSQEAIIKSGTEVLVIVNQYNSGY